MRHLLCTLLLIGAIPAAGQEVFRDFHFIPADGNQFSELDPYTTRDFTTRHTWAQNKQRYAPKELELDIEGATRAELSVAYWGGHIGTTGQQVNINGFGWVNLPQPAGTPGHPECYHRTLLGNNSLEIPLDQLKQGANIFRFAAAAQRCYSFDFGFYWIYGFTVRVHYEPDKQHPSGRVAVESQGGRLGDEVRLRAALDDPERVERVDFFVESEDFDWDGDGVWREWQFQQRHGKYSRHAGSATHAPWTSVWDTSWLPDQPEPMRVRAQITGRNGVSYLTEPVDGLQLDRGGRTVRMFRSEDIPERFSARDGGRKQCTIVLPERLDKVTEARMVVSSWSASTDDEGPHEIILNGERLANRFGTFHDYDLSTLELEVERLRPGVNTIEVYSEYKGHALEINWPGPVILLESAGRR